MSEPTKAVLTCIDDGSLSLDIAFNPTTFNFSRKVNWAEQAPALRPYTTLQFGNGSSDTMSVSLMLDDTEDDQDGEVMDTIELLYELTVPQTISGVIRPPLVSFDWGNFTFQGVVQAVDFEANLFDTDGVIRRANAKLTLLGRAFSDETSSADFFGQ